MIPNLCRLVPCVLAVSACAVGIAHAQQDTAVERGRRLAEAYCSGCHAVGNSGDSPVPIAPPFRALHERYPVEYLQEALGEGIVSGHPSMPQFTFPPHQIADFIAYLKSLER